MKNQKSKQNELADNIKPAQDSPEVSHGKRSNGTTVKSESKGNQAESQQALVDRINASDRWMIILTAAIVITSIVSAVFFYQQWQTMHGQLDEMKSTGKQTDALIKANYGLVSSAKKQAEAAIKQASAAVEVANISRAASIAAQTTANAAKITANAANESNRLSLLAMNAQQRPWISVGVEIAGPLDFDAYYWSNTNWHLPLKYRLQHLGKTPATDVSFNAEMIPWILPQQSQDLPTYIAKEIKSVCDFPERMTALHIGEGQVLFPGEQNENLFSLNGNPGRFDEAKKISGDYMGHFLIVVCVTYGTTYSSESYRTAKVFNLYKPTGKMIDLNGEHIPINELAIMPHPQRTGSYAN